MECLRARWLRPNHAKSFLLLSLLSALVYITPTHAKTPPIALVQVSSSVKRSEIDLSRVLRSTILQQLRHIELPQVSQEEQVVLSASLVELKTQRSGSRVTSSCVVSATLRKKQGGALIAMMRGRAQAHDEGGTLSENEVAALQAAVRSALRGIPKALQ